MVESAVVSKEVAGALARTGCRWLTASKMRGQQHRRHEDNQAPKQ
jgi:hypothetical protein